MIYYKIMTGISLASFARMVLALHSAGKDFIVDAHWNGDKPEMWIVPRDALEAAKAEYIDRITERVDIGRNWIKKVVE